MNITKSDFEMIYSHLAHYCHLVDQGSAEEIADLYWDDAVLEFNGRFQGINEITESYRQWIKKMREPVQGLRHLIYAPHIEIEDKIAHATCYFDADGISKKTDASIMVRGLYKDTLEKRDKWWKFAKRQIVVY